MKTSRKSTISERLVPSAHLQCSQGTLGGLLCTKTSLAAGEFFFALHTLEKESTKLFCLPRIKARNLKEIQLSCSKEYGNTLAGELKGACHSSDF